MSRSRLVPMLPVKSMPESVEFYRKLGFDFYGMNEFRLDDPDGNQLWIGETPAKEA